jgi:hypothetical protein
MQLAIPKVDAAKAALPTINVKGYNITGKQTTIYYHNGPKCLEEIPALHWREGHHLSMSSAKKTRELENLLLCSWKPLFEHDEVEVDYKDKAADTRVRETIKEARTAIKLLPEWDACLRRLRRQVRDITSGTFKQDRHARRRAAAKEAIKEAARACITRYYVKFDEVVVLAEEAVKELQIEDVMEG